MSQRRVLLIEPSYKNKYPPMGLMKLATYFRSRGDDVYFFKGDPKDFASELLCNEFIVRIQGKELLRYKSLICKYIRAGKLANLESALSCLSVDDIELLKIFHERYRKKKYPLFDIVGVTTLFTFYWKRTVEAIKSAKPFLAPNGRFLIGGIASTILPEQMEKDTGIAPIVGLLDKPFMIDDDGAEIIDKLPLDYSILEEIDYVYPAKNAYFAYMTRGCPNKCAFCAVPHLEPQYCNYIGIAEQLKTVERQYGAKKDLLLLDNNVFASEQFNQIIDEIKLCGFKNGEVYNPANEYDVAFSNISAPIEEHRNIRAYTKKIIKIYDELAENISDEKEQGEFYLAREKADLLYPLFATRDNIIEFDKKARPLAEKAYKPHPKARYVDFNQGVDARLVTEEKMSKLSEVAIRPLRIAFDHYEMRDIYINAVRTAAKYGITYLSNYLLYNFKDRPEDLYERMRINVNLCEELDVTIFSFPMKYHPIDDPEWFDNRDYIGPHWNRKFIRAVQAVLNSTKGKIGRGKSFFEEAFGKDVDDFMRILWMPETFIIYRRMYDENLRVRLSERYDNQTENDCNLANEWWDKFSKLSADQLETAKKIISLNRFKDGDYECEDPVIEDVLSYYKIMRK